MQRLHAVCALLAVALCVTASSDAEQVLTRYDLPAPAVCNDGSPAVVFARFNASSDVFVVRLEGGAACFSEVSCEFRWRTSAVLMTSTQFGDSMVVGGIMSPNASSNPYLSTANLVFVPYCSSDIWAGTASPSEGQPWHFQGAAIVSAAIELLAGHGLPGAKQVLLCGDSAGGIGVTGVADRVMGMVQELAPAAKFGALIDSGWFLDAIPLQWGICNNSIFQCTEQEYITAGIPLWNALLPDNCSPPPGREYQCWMSYFNHPKRAPSLVFEWGFDSAQLAHDAIFSADQFDTNATVMNYVLQQRSFLLHTLRTAQPAVTAFSPACYMHTVIGYDGWATVAINGVTVPRFVDLWMQGVVPPGVVLTDECQTVNCNPTCP